MIFNKLYHFSVHFWVELTASVWVLVWMLFAFDGHYGYDDMEYAKIAQSILQGNFGFSQPFDYRLTLTLPMALFFLLFGIEDFSALAFNYICSVSLIFFVGSVFKSKAKKIYALSVLSSSYYWLWYTAKIYPDVEVALFHFSAVWFAVFYSEKKPILSAFGVSLSLFLGFMAKETIVFVLPYFAFLFFDDLISKLLFLDKRKKIFWGSLFCLNALFFGSFFVFCLWQTGSLFHRFELISQNRYFNPCSYDQMPFQRTVERITTGYLGLLFSSGIAFGVIFAFFADQTAFRWRRPLILALLSFNFLSTSWDSYLPMCLEGRHFLAIVPLGAVVSGYGFASHFSKKSMLKTISWAILTGLGAYFFAGKLIFLYLTTVFLVVLNLFFLKNHAFAALIFVGLFIHAVYVMTKPSQSYYSEEKKLLREHKSQINLLVSDEIGARVGAYILGYQVETKSYESSITAKEFWILVQPFNENYLRLYATDSKLSTEYLKSSSLKEARRIKTKNLTLIKIVASKD